MVNDAEPRQDAQPVSDRARKAAAEFHGYSTWESAHQNFALTDRHKTDLRITAEAFATFERDLPPPASGFAAGVEAELTHEQADEGGRAAYAAYCGMAPIDMEPDWGREGYKIEAGVWQAVARAVCRALTPPPASEGQDADEALYKIVCEAMTSPAEYCEFANNGMQDWCARAVVIAIRPALEAERATWEGEVAGWLEAKATDNRFDDLYAAIAGAIRSGAYRETDGG